MSESDKTKTITLSDLFLFKNAYEKRTLLSLTLELTHRCNNNCLHCYINIPADNREAKEKELSFKEIKNIMDQAFSMGTLWVLLTGGEPLLRDDFFDIYLYLKRKGFLVSVFTNASLISDEHIKLFQKYPPRDIEVSVYGVTEKTHKKVTRNNTFSATMEGIEKLISGHVPVTFKTTLMKSNYREIKQIAGFCEKITKNAFRFDPFLTLRLDRDNKKNNQIIRERLSAGEILELDKLDKKRYHAIKEQCRAVDGMTFKDKGRLFRCRAGINSVCIDCYGILKLCSSLMDKKCLYNLQEGSLEDAWNNFVPGIRMMKSYNTAFRNKCGVCDITDLCMWCPAHSYLETGKIDEPVQYFCDTAHKRYFYFHDDMA